MNNNIITVDLHGDYDVQIGQKIKEGQVIGSCNGWPNYNPHRHLGLFKVNDVVASVGGVGETFEHLYRKGLSFESLDPITNTPDWFNASATGFSYLQEARSWFRWNRNVDIAGKHFYIANNTPQGEPSDCYHDGSDIGSNQGIYKGSPLKSPFDAVVIDVGYTEGGLTFCIMAKVEKEELPTRPRDKAKIDFSKPAVVVKFTGEVPMLNASGKIFKKTPQNWWASVINLNNGYYLATWANGETFYLYSWDVNGDRVQAV